MSEGCSKKSGAPSNEGAPEPSPRGLPRRDFLQSIAVFGAFTGFAGYLGRSRTEHLEAVGQARRSYLRPPGALAEKEFLARCIRCHKCGEVCPNSAVQHMPRTAGPAVYDTPYINPREQACILCMKCTQACPTGALKRVASDDGETIQREVKMGTARVDKNICYSYNGFICGVCVWACPFQGQALRAEVWERPIVDEKRCVGCGLCVKACIHYPAAINVIPQRGGVA